MNDSEAVDKLYKERIEAQDWEPTLNDLNDFRRVIKSGNRDLCTGYRDLIDNEFKLDKIMQAFHDRYFIWLQNKLERATDIQTLAIILECGDWLGEDVHTEAVNKAKSLSNNQRYELKKRQDQYMIEFENMEIK